MVVPGLIPGLRKSLFWGRVGKAFSLIFTHILACRVTLLTLFGELGSLFGRVGVTFSSFLGCLGKCLGVVWGHF